MNKSGNQIHKDKQDLAIHLIDVGIRYRKLGERTTSYKDYVLKWVKGDNLTTYFWALRDISLSIMRGESIGIIGDNGAGKSTLLRVLANILYPSIGTVETRGEITPILELGSLFDQELTGRENIYLNGAMLGFPRRVMNEKMDQIIEFSGIEYFIDSPLRTYSSGMITRLAFALATDIETDIVLIDEVLAVGDNKFREKCVARIERIKEQGTTFIVVSHNLDLIKRLCSRVIWLEHGKIIADGKPEEVLEGYHNLAKQNLFETSQVDRS